MEKSAKQATVEVLGRAGEPLKAREIGRRVLKVTGVELKGKTPMASISAMLYVEAKKPDGVFVKTGKGEFDLRERQAAKPSRRRRAKAGS